MAIDWRMDKQNVFYPNNEILLAIKKKWSTDTGYNMDEFWQHYAKWKKRGTKGCVVYDSINTNCPELAKSIETEYRLVVPGVRRKEWGVTANGFLSEVTEMLWK